MGKQFEGVQRLKSLGIEVIALMAQGKKETISEIKKQADNNNISQYITDKYKDEILDGFADNPNIDFQLWNTSISNWMDTNKRSNLCLENEDDGLLYLLAAIFDLTAKF